MQPVRAEITEFESGFSAETFLDRSAPLFDVLRRGVGFEGGETHGGNTQYSRREVKVSGNYWRGRSEVVTLLRFRKHKRHVVALVAPCVHVDGSKEDAERSMQHNAVLVQIVRDAKARRKLHFFGVVKASRKSLLPADENSRHAVLKSQVGIGVA